MRCRCRGVGMVAAFGMGLLLSGWADACRGSGFYAFGVETLIYRDLNLSKNPPRGMTECGIVIGGVLLVLEVAFRQRYRGEKINASSMSARAFWSVAITLSRSWTEIVPQNSPFSSTTSK